MGFDNGGYSPPPSSSTGGGSIPSGGNTGQVLEKNSSSDFDTGWGTLTAAATAAPYANATVYGLGQQATFNGLVIYATAAHTSSTATPDATKWQVLGLAATDRHVGLYGAAGLAAQGGKFGDDGAMTSGQATLTGTGFTPAMAGMQVYVRGAGAAGVGILTTVSAYVDATHLTLAVNAPTTVSGARYVIGNDNTAAINNAIAAVCALAGGGRVIYDAGVYWLNTNAASTGNGAANKSVLIHTLYLLNGTVPYKVVEHRGAAPGRSEIAVQGFTNGVTISGTILYHCNPQSDNGVAGSTPLGAVMGFGDASGGSFQGYYSVCRDIEFRTPCQGKYHGLDQGAAGTAHCERTTCGVDTVESFGLTSSFSYGIQPPTLNNGAQSNYIACGAYGYNYGWRLEEHLNQVGCWSSRNAFGAFMANGAEHGMRLDMLIQDCLHDLGAVNTTLVTGGQRLSGFLRSESATTGPYTNSDQVNDNGSVLHGALTWAKVVAGTGPSMTITKTGGTNLTVTAI